MIQIRPYQPGDDEQIRAFINAILEEFDIGQTVDEDEDMQNIAAYFDFENGGGFWVLEDDGKIVGTIGLHRLDEESCYFSRFYLHPDYRGQGWGSKLWHNRAEYMKPFNYKKAYATSNHKFEDAVRFYETHGYERITADELPVPVNWADLFYVKKLE